MHQQLFEIYTDSGLASLVIVTKFFKASTSRSTQIKIVQLYIKMKCTIWPFDIEETSSVNL